MTPDGFQRARSDEQRAERRRAVLDTAAAMLAEMPVAELSLNELSRRVGLAKSNVLRYFESREAVLLELLDAAERDYLAELAGALPPAAGPLGRRRETVAAVLARALAARPVLCDLLGAQAAVLERNVSTRVVMGYKRAGIARLARFAELLRRSLPELGESDAAAVAGTTMITAGAAWSHANPSPAVAAAYLEEPSLAALRVGYEPLLRELIAVNIAGVLGRGTGELIAARTPAGQTDSSSSTVTAAPSSARSAGSAGS